ncbi:protein ECERIFERUM 16 isoform X1 [Arachis stenosperma]|uniref:protein ECERIFERUM 16 isoform X1 n=1 Tax=Arachis stenosperma TaxID=217475 RepID=UPI0025ACDF83|nr:protein ECERIFERUM 16 isoform X1 [Arachis stenosperma]XP_057750819.1 protein ECERIFERUM 16 isoform X1 [Arachis stenosperma]
MDVKSLAKSKRAHTQHHTKKPHHKHKTPTPSQSSPSSSSDVSNDVIGSRKKQLNQKGTTVNRNSSSRASSTLPNNWDRYYDEDEEIDSVIAEGATKVPNDGAVLLKSKGADFRHLVDEARSQADASLEGLPSLDDTLPGEFNVGLGSMLAVRGEGFVSWIGDDNFVVEEKPGAYQEASFISLNLHALAENLAKVELSKRLFIEPDLLPTELSMEGLSEGSNEENYKLESTGDSELGNLISKEVNSDVLAIDQFTSSTPYGSSHAACTFSADFPLSVNHIDIQFQQVDSSHESKASFPSVEANLLPAEDTRRKHSTFEAADAEKELDMLLDSLSETKILDTQGYKPNTPSVSLGAFKVDPPGISKRESVAPKTASSSASLDDVLDDLLEETSTLTNSNVLVRPQEEKSVLQSVQSSHSESKSKVTDDFDSWFGTL